MTPSTWAVIYGTRTAVAVGLLHARLVPDSAEYAHGAASWSSPLLAASGLAGGRLGVDAVAVASSSLLGYLVGRSVTDSRRSDRWSWALFLSPPGWFAAFPAADAAGAVGTVAVAGRLRTVAAIALVAACHLEAAAVVACVRLAARLGARRAGAVALLAGVAACLGEQHLQTRYLLPGAALVAARGRL